MSSETARREAAARPRSAASSLVSSSVAPRRSACAAWAIAAAPRVELRARRARVGLEAGRVCDEPRALGLGAEQLVEPAAAGLVARARSGRHAVHHALVFARVLGASAGEERVRECHPCLR